MSKKGIKQSPEHIRKRIKSLVEGGKLKLPRKSPSAETRLKISLANKGTKPKQQTIEASVKARKGKHLTIKHRRKIGRVGNKNGMWKGNDAGYNAIHIWINSHLIDHKLCRYCGSKNNLHWSNKNHLYKRIKSDWQRVCAKCHRKYDDIKFGKRIPWNKGKNFVL
jgi:hypothetical protein